MLRSIPMLRGCNRRGKYPSTRHVHDATPQYPKESRAVGDQGRVVVRALIAEDGSPIKVEVLSSSGHTRLDEAALAAVAKSTFEPATRDGQVVQDWFSIPISLCCCPIK